MDINTILNTPDTTSEFEEQDIKSNTVMGILSYIGILVLIPIFAAKDSKYARYHANQGLILVIVDIVVSAVAFVLGAIPFIGWIFSIVGGLAGLICLALTVIGIINAAKGQEKELPIIGKYRILK